MNEKIPPSVLLLISHPGIFEGMKTAIQKEGYCVHEDFDALDDTDLVLMDSFYLNAGTANFVKKESRRISTVLVHFSHEFLNIKNQFMKLIDNTISFQSSENTGDSFLSQLKDFSSSLQRHEKEFGRGLWVSLIDQLAAGAFTASRTSL